MAKKPVKKQLFYIVICQVLVITLMFFMMGKIIRDNEVGTIIPKISYIYNDAEIIEPEETPLMIRTVENTASLIPKVTPLDIGNPVPDIVDDGFMYNGYWWGSEGWIPGLVTYETQFLRLPKVSVGSAVFYAPQAMEANVEARGLPWKDTYVGSVAVEFCSEIGHTVWLKRPNSKEWEGEFLVADCSRRNDLYGHIIYRDQVVEVDFETAVRWGIAKYTTTNDKGWMALTNRLDGVLVSTVPPEEYDGNIVDLSVWFLNNVRYAEYTEIDLLKNYLPPAYDGTIKGGLGFKNPSDLLPMWLLGGEWIIFH